MFRKVWIFFLALALAACNVPSVTTAAPDGPAPTETPFVPDPGDIAGPIPAVTPAFDPLTDEMLRNAPYTLGGQDTLDVIWFVDGVYQQGSDPSAVGYVSAEMLEPPAFGDLNGDGLVDAAALVAEHYGGTGVFVYLAIYLNNLGQPLYNGSGIIDDRPIINALAIQDGFILLDAVIHSYEDPLCCPSFHVNETYYLGPAGLTWGRRTSFTPEGSERAIDITLPAAGEHPAGPLHVTGSVTIAPFENNLVYVLLDQTNTVLVSGSLTVSAAEPGAPGTFDTVIDLGDLPTGCTVRLEIRDLSAADGLLLALDSVEMTIK
jgi:hypothetical protein